MSHKRVMSRASRRRSGALLLAGATLLVLPATANAVDTAGVTELVSTSSDEAAADNTSTMSAVSADGRYVAFASTATNLVPEDTNISADVFVRDRLGGTTERVSVSGSGRQGDADSGWLDLLGAPSISEDGRYVAFASDATNLVKGDRNGGADVFVHDRVTGATTRVSVASDGSEAGGTMPAISGDGRYVGFLSDAPALTGDEFGSRADVFVHDRQTGVTERISQAPDGSDPNANSTFAPHLSTDGRFVYFTSSASNLVPGPDASGHDAFLFDRQARTMRAITSDHDPDAFVTNHGTAEGISANGRYVTFTTADGFFSPETDTNGFDEDAWLVDTQTDVYTLVSRNDLGEQANELSFGGPVSDDGRLVVFESEGTNLGGPSTFGFNVYLRDVAAGTTRLVSVAPNGDVLATARKNPSMTPDGQVVGFDYATDVFVRDMRPAADLAVSMADSPDPVAQRGQVTYTVTVDNLGPGQATDSTLVDNLPQATFVSASPSQGSCAHEGKAKSDGVLTCDLGTLEAGATATVSVVVSPPRDGTITNTATVRAAQPDTNTANNAASETTTVTP
jgi:uncharacterized repeat protein (TIGR01451 family)